MSILCCVFNTFGICNHVSKPKHRNERLKVLHIHAKASIKQHGRWNNEIIQMAHVQIELQDEISSLSVAGRTLYAKTTHSRSRLVARNFAHRIKPEATQKQLKQQLDPPQVND